MRWLLFLACLSAASIGLGLVWFAATCVCDRVERYVVRRVTEEVKLARKLSERERLDQTIARERTNGDLALLRGGKQ